MHKYLNYFFLMCFFSELLICIHFSEGSEKSYFDIFLIFLSFNLFYAMTSFTKKYIYILPLAILLLFIVYMNSKLSLILLIPIYLYRLFLSRETIEINPYQAPILSVIKKYSYIDYVIMAIFLLSIIML